MKIRFVSLITIDATIQSGYCNASYAKDQLKKLVLKAEENCSDPYAGYSVKAKFKEGYLSCRIKFENRKVSYHSF